jgi:hypothetical protein
MVKEIYQDGKGDLKEITKNSLRNLKLMNFQLRINTLLNLQRRNIWRKEEEKGGYREGKFVTDLAPAQRGKEWEGSPVNIKGDHYGHYRNHR